MYLSDDEFSKLFKMSKDDFKSKKDWKKRSLKEKHGLW